VDQAGVICQQDGIFRVNCMDCLDRTNVVQAAIARAVMEQQVRSVPKRVGRKLNWFVFVANCPQIALF